MYKRKADIKANHFTMTVFIVLFILAVLFYMLKPTRITSPDSIQTIVVHEIYRNYTVERTNGQVTLLLLDPDVYAIACDAKDVSNEEGHTCVIANINDIWEALTLIGYQ